MNNNLVWKKACHKEHGNGVIVKDIEGTCHENEVLLKLRDQTFPSGLSYSSEWSGFINYATIDIVKIEDLTML